MRILAILPLIAMLLSACDIDVLDGNDDEENGEEGQQWHGYVINEGNFGQGNASVTAFDLEEDRFEQQYFEAQTERLLGDVAESSTMIGDRIYIAVNGSNKIEVVDAHDFESIATIEGEELSSPRNIAETGDGRAYVTTYTSRIVELDLEENQVAGSIETGYWTEDIAVVGGTAYVSAPYELDFEEPRDVLLSIDTFDDAVTAVMEMGEDITGDVEVDDQDRVWVMGGLFSDGAAAVHVLDGANGQLLQTIELESSGGAMTLNEQDQVVYVADLGVRNIDMEALELMDEALTEQNFAEVAYDEGQTGLVFAADPKDFEQAGEAVVFDIDGTVVETFETGIIPGHFQFLGQ